MHTSNTSNGVENSTLYFIPSNFSGHKKVTKKLQMQLGIYEKLQAPAGW